MHALKAGAPPLCSLTKNRYPRRRTARSWHHRGRRAASHAQREAPTPPGHSGGIRAFPPELLRRPFPSLRGRRSVQGAPLPLLLELCLLVVAPFGVGELLLAEALAALRGRFESLRTPAARRAGAPIIAEKQKQKSNMRFPDQRASATGISTRGVRFQRRRRQCQILARLRVEWRACPVRRRRLFRAFSPARPSAP